MIHSSFRITSHNHTYTRCHNYINISCQQRTLHAIIDDKDKLNICAISEKIGVVWVYVDEFHQFTPKSARKTTMQEI